MPKRKFGTSARTRPFKKAKTSHSSYIKLVTGPKTLVRKLRYVTRQTIDAGTLGSATNLFIRANGCFDPEVAVGGHQVLGFDQYMAMYDHFKVTSSKVTVTALGGIEGGANNTILSIYLDDDVTANGSMDNMIEQGLTTYRVVSSGAVPPTTVSKSFRSNDFFSSKKYSSEIVGDEASDPTEQAFFNISVAALDTGVNPDRIQCLIVVDYVVEFSERKTLVQS